MIIDQEVLNQIKERGPSGWKLDQLPDDVYISIKWNHNGGRGAVVSTSIVL